MKIVERLVPSSRRYAANPFIVPKIRIALSFRLEVQPRGKHILKRIVSNVLLCDVMLCQISLALESKKKRH